MCLLGPLDSVHVGVQLGSAFLSKSRCVGCGVKPWGGGHWPVSRIDLRPGACLGLGQCRGGHRFGCFGRRSFAHGFCTGPDVLGDGFGRFGVAIEFAQQRISRCLLLFDAADLGAGAVHPVPRTDPVAGLVVALCVLDLSGEPFVFGEGHAPALRLRA